MREACVSRRHVFSRLHERPRPGICERSQHASHPGAAALSARRAGVVTCLVRRVGCLIRARWFAAQTLGEIRQMLGQEQLERMRKHPGFARLPGGESQFVSMITMARVCQHSRESVRLWPWDVSSSR